ncbi:MAG: DUF2252 domain-containing protein [Acidimicrobiales bacterium]
MTVSGTLRSTSSSTRHESVDDRIAIGKRARELVPRRRHGEWAPGPGRPDALSILEDQERTRVPDLVPIRHGRMAASAFAYYRGAAAVMASDLGSEPRTGLDVQLCGDAHLVNFGGFAAPDRTLVFDVNDFDETLPGPFEWDVKRLAASLEIAARDREMRRSLRQEVVAAGARAYRLAIREFAGMRMLDVWYSRLDIAAMKSRWGGEASQTTVENMQRLAAKAEGKDQLKAFDKLTQADDGVVRFVSDPPLLVPVSELAAGIEVDFIEDTVGKALRSYRKTLAGDRRHLFDNYRFVDLARKVVGVGSVGTRCWVALLLGRDEHDPLFIQIKEAEASVLEPYLKKSEYANHGQRVVEGQRLMQAASDILLGWDNVQGLDGETRDYYMRQLWDWKASADIATMPLENLSLYAQICGWTLARGHARSGDAIAIGAYLGTGDVFDRSIVDFAGAYAEQNDLDHRQLVDAIHSGKVQATTGV